MSVPPLLPIGKPGFGLAHIALEAAATGGTNGPQVLGGSSAEDALLDDGLVGRVAQRVGAVSESGGFGLRRETPEETRRRPMHLVSMLGNNWYSTRRVFGMFDNVGDNINYADDAASPIIEVGMPGGTHWVTRMGAVGAAAPACLESATFFTPYLGVPTITMDLGEFYATQLLYPTNGISTSWIWDIEENLAQSTTLAGSVFTTQLGPPRRAFTLTQTNVPAAEVGLWKQVIAKIATGQPFVYVPPEFGQAIQPRIVTDDLAEWSSSPAGAVLQIAATGHDPSGSDALTITPDPANLDTNHTITNTAAAFPNGPEDWSQKWLQVDIRQFDWAWLTTQLEFIVRIISGNVSTTYDLTNFVFPESPGSDDWVRFYIDPVNHPDQSTQTTHGADLTAVSGLQFLYRPVLLTDVMSVCNIDLVDPRKLPAYVNSVPGTHSLEQDSDSPRADPTYQVELTFLESLA